MGKVVSSRSELKDPPGGSWLRFIRAALEIEQHLGH